MPSKRMIEAGLMLIGIEKQIDGWNSIPADDKEIILERILRTLNEMIVVFSPFIVAGLKEDREMARTIVEKAALLLDSARLLS